MSAIIDQSFVVHYGGQLHSVEANTFANSLVALSKIFEEINTIVFPDFRIEIRVEALSEGSFRPTLKLYSSKAISSLKPFLPEKSQIIFIFLALLQMYQSANTVTKIDGDNVIIVKESAPVIENPVEIPVEAYEKAQKLQKNREIKSAIAENFRVINEDPYITSFGITKQKDSEDYLFFESEENFGKYLDLSAPLDEGKKEVIYDSVELKLLKVILERSPRKWEFVWNGIKISAAITDEEFWENLRTQKIKIAQGDSITVDLKIYQTQDPYSTFYLNDRYEVVKVRGYNESLKQKDDLFDKK